MGKSNRVSLHGLSPEDALRALLAVDPDEPEADGAGAETDRTSTEGEQS
jgi:hypothetical protein